MGYFQFKALEKDSFLLNQEFINHILQKEQDGVEFDYDENLTYVQTQERYDKLRAEAKRGIEADTSIPAEIKARAISKAIGNINRLQALKPVGIGFFSFQEGDCCPKILSEVVNFTLTNVQKFEYITGLVEAYKIGLIKQPPTDAIRNGRFVKDMFNMGTKRPY